MAATTGAILVTTALLAATPGFKCDSHGTTDGGTGCATLAVDDPSVSLAGFTRFSPDEKRNDPNAGDPSYVFLAAGREAVVIPGPDVADTGGLFTLRNQSISMVGVRSTSADGYAVTVNEHLGYQVAIDDFEFEVSLARVELCELDHAIQSHFVFSGNPDASGVAHDIRIQATVNGVAAGTPTLPVTVEVR